MNKRTSWGICGIFVSFIALFFLLNLIVPDKDFSPQENRSLQTAPTLTFDGIVSGDYMSDFESYCSDQFVLRDRWISMKARMELFLGKSDNNGIFLCSNEQLLEPFAAPSASDLDSRIYAVNALAENTHIPVYLGLIPSAAEIHRDLLPAGVKNDSQQAIINYVYDNVNAKTIDFMTHLQDHSSEYIFYRTDHHWTSLGAYYGFEALADAMELSLPPLDDYPQRKMISDRFHGTTYSTSGFAWVQPDQMEIFIEQPENVIIQRYEGATPQQIPLYDYEFLDQKDKYSFYLGGNTPRLVIQTGHTEKPSALILRDSYCDSLTPFLLESFSEIHILDLRYYRESIVSYIETYEIDQTMVLYSVNNFCTDRNLILLSR